MEANFFEWYKLRVPHACKHIFLRDVYKQWYLAGINKQINTVEKLVDFLRKETEGFGVITVGSSAGGYAAILFGCILGAERVLAFNPQFELNSLLSRSSEGTDPLLFRFQDTPLRKYYDLTTLLTSPMANVFYFFSCKSPLDIVQYRYVQCRSTKIHILSFVTAHHGIPFLKVALPKVLAMGREELTRYERRKNAPMIFTIRLVGLKNAVYGLVKQIRDRYKRRH